jgi:hypothetical protein
MANLKILIGTAMQEKNIWLIDNKEKFLMISFKQSFVQNYNIIFKMLIKL